MRATQSITDQFSLPGFVDIIFLLLIFSMATMSFTAGRDTVPVPGSERFLPLVPRTLSESPDQYLQNLLIIVGFTNPQSFQTPEPDSSRRVILLRPGRSGQENLTIKEALDLALTDGRYTASLPDRRSLLALNDRDFRELDACRLIVQEMDAYSRSLSSGNPNNTVEIRAVRETEFRFINFILTETCRDENLIPRIVLHTLAGL